MAVSSKLTYDVWFQAANTVYKQVPFTVVADWVAQGRLNAADRLRESGTENWRQVDQFRRFADYLPRPMVSSVESVETTSIEGTSGESQEQPELEHVARRRRDDTDDEVDMIPLIDISMVLLVFFIMMRAAGALSPVDVPDMQYAAEINKDPNTITLAIEKADETNVVYSLRIGDQPPKPEDAKLASQRETLERLKDIVATMESPPEVRVACAQNLPSQRVFELIPDLKALKSKKKIRGFNAEVNEASRK
jgi:biopolymer transport protein ExbD